MLQNSSSQNPADFGLEKLGLRSGQFRALRHIACDYEWFDKYANRLGFGELDTSDLRRIAGELGPDDVFIAVERPDLCLRTGTAMGQKPSLESLAAHSSYVISQGRVCRIVEKPEGVTVLDGCMMLWPMTREVLRRRLLGGWN
jgi:hypothetical protein